ncbi:MAG TPA: acyltransferase [Actinomycetota bacterium]|nr:acyltransferase [Actinomycetota bacterium]
MVNQTDRAGDASLGARKRQRVHHLDWLRVAAVFGVFLFHAIHPFDEFEWHVKNAEQSSVISFLIVVLFPWGLGFFFLISGASSFLALRFRSTSAYVRERLQRLLVPFVVGWLVLSPVQAFIELRHKGQWQGGFLSFVPHFFSPNGEAALQLRLRPLPLGWSYHLWFLVFLLWFSLLGLPLFLALRRSNHRFVDWLAERSGWRGSTLLFAVPVALAHIAVRAASPDEHEWGEFAYYFAFFVVGYLLVSDERLIGAVRRDLVPAVVLAVVGGGIFLALNPVEWVEQWSELPRYSWTYVVMFSMFSIQAWGWALAAFSIGLRLKTLSRPLPQTIGSRAMPFFVLHQPVILAFAYFIVGMSAGIPLKLTAVLLPSFVVTALLSVGAETAPGIRSLLGSKPRP